MHLAEINIGRLNADPLDPEVAEFMNNLDRVNAIADRSDGFIWRLQGESGNATEFTLDNDPRFIANLSVWRDIESFHFYVFNTLHKAFLRRRTEWFAPLKQPHFAMWFVENDHIPSLAEGMEKLKYLAENGESRTAFTWKSVQDGQYTAPAS